VEIINVVNFMNFMKKKSFVSIFLSWIVSVTIVFGTVVLMPAGEVAFAASPFDTGLVSYWNLNSDANDSKGTSNGTVSGATPTVSGKIGGAYDFSTDNDVINLAVGEFPTVGTGNFSFSAWIKTDGGPTHLYQTIFGINGYDPSLYIRSGAYMSIYDQTNYDSAIDSSVGKDFNDNGWHHMVFVRTGTGSNETKFYVDGVAIGTKTYDLSINAPTSLRIGYSGSGSEDFEGTLDELAFWTRDLSAAEVVTLYNSGDGLAWSANTGPTAASLSAVQKADGSGAVDISVILDDADDDDTVYATIKYEAGSCAGSEVNAALDSTPANVSATTGTPVVSGAVVGTGDGWILTSSGANTVQFDWLSASNVASADGTYCIQLTSHDGTAEGTVATKTFTVDNVDPTASGNLTLNAITTTSITHDLGVAGSDTNIDNYKIYYKAGASGVATTDGLDATIATAAYDADGTNEISGLSANTQYVANIWTYDAYGNFAAATELAKYTAANTPGTSTVDGATVSALNVTINTNSNPATTEFAIQETGTGFYVQGDGTLSDSADWQVAGTEAGEWGETSAVSGKVQVTGLSLNTQYTFQVQARNGDNTETSFGSTAAAYTLAEASSAPTVDTPTTSSLGVTISQGSNPSTTTYKIQETGGSLYVQTDGTLGAEEAWQTAASWGTGGKKIVTGLSVNAQYTFVTTGRNVDLVPTAASSSAAAYTAANAPGVPTVDGAATTTLEVTIDTNSNPSTTEYYIYEVNTAQYVQTNGLLGGVVVWQPVGTSSGNWGKTSGTSGLVLVGELSVNTSYDFKIKARNGGNEETAYGTSASLYTLANVPANVSAATSGGNVVVTWGANSNSSATEYYVERTDAGVNSGWISAISWTDTTGYGGTNYTYSVKARNANSTETTAVSSASVVYPGGGVGFFNSRPASRSTQSTQKSLQEAVVVEDEVDVEDEVVVEVEVDAEEEVVVEEVEEVSEVVVENIDEDFSQSDLSEEIVKYVAGESSVMSDGKFDLDAYLTRAAAVKAICLRMGIDLDSEDSISGQELLDRVVGFVFEDVEDFDAWYSYYVGVAKIMGIVNGHSDNTFRPEGKVLRVEAIKMIVIANEWEVVSFDSEKFPFINVYESDWYAGYLQTAYDFGVLRDYTLSDAFESAEYITVAEFSSLLSYLDNEVEDNEFLMVMGE